MPQDLTPFAARLLPARPDLAASHLEGRVAAARFAAGARRMVTATLLDLTMRPEPGARLATQLLTGEMFTVYEDRDDGLAWGQAETDGYVGYVDAAGLGPANGTGQRVTALWSQIYPSPDVKARVARELPFLASVAVAGTTGAFARLRGGGHVPRAHFAPITGDFVAQAERFRGAPYLWGGRSARGLDCSALVQLSLMATGLNVPRDSDMLAALVGAPLAADEAPKRGDLVFWKGHVGMLSDPETLLHSNAFHMTVTTEPLAPTIARIVAAGGGPVIARRRIATN